MWFAANPCRISIVIDIVEWRGRWMEDVGEPCSASPRSPSVRARLKGEPYRMSLHVDRAKSAPLERNTIERRCLSLYKHPGYLSQLPSTYSKFGLEHSMQKCRFLLRIWCFNGPEANIPSRVALLSPASSYLRPEACLHGLIAEFTSPVKSNGSKNAGMQRTSCKLDQPQIKFGRQHKSYP